MKNFDETVKFFENDRFATENGMYIEEIGENYAKCALKITERHKNAVGAVMGGVMFTLADFAFAVASNVNSSHTVSLNSDIVYFSQPKGEILFAEAGLKKDGKSTCCFGVDVYDEKNTKVAYVLITGYHIN